MKLYDINSEIETLLSALTVDPVKLEAYADAAERVWSRIAEAE